MAGEERRQGSGNGTSDEMADGAAGAGAAAGPGGDKQPGGGVKGRVPSFEEGGPPEWDPNTTNGGAVGGGGAGGAGGVTRGASGRSNQGR
jgi:hypothetical protein